MKKVVVLFLLICSLAGVSQPIITRTYGTNTVSDPRLMAKLNFFPPRYTDTTAANLQKGIDSCGALIYTYDVDGFWYRQCFPKKWVRFTSGSGGVGVQSVTGTAVNITDPLNPIINLYRFGAEDNSSSINRSMNMNQHVFNLNGASSVFISSFDIAAGGVSSSLNLVTDNTSIEQVDNAYTLRYKFIPAKNLQGNFYVPLTVNGVSANDTGNIVIAVGSGSGGGLLHVVAGTKLSQVNDSTIKLADSVWSNIYARLSEKVKYTDTAAMLANIAAKLNLHTDSITSIHAQIVALASTLDDLLDTSGSIEADSLYYPLTGNPSNFLIQATTDALYSALGHTHTFASLTSKPTTLAGYGITDAEPTLTAPNSIKRYLNGYKQFVSFNSDSVTEGSTNLYYTAVRAALKVNVSDTAAAWSGYATKINLHTDSIASIHSQIVGLASTSATHTTNIALKLNSADYIVRETPTGSVNGSNVTFTLANTPVAGKEMIFLNGVLQMAAGDEYSISGGTITFITAPETGDKIRVTYIK